MRIIREPEVCLRTGLSRSTRWRLQQQGKFPKPRRLSPHAVGYLETDIQQWIAERFGTTAESEQAR
jgi:prophage regulatory protein